MCNEYIEFKTKYIVNKVLSNLEVIEIY